MEALNSAVLEPRNLGGVQSQQRQVTRSFSPVTASGRVGTSVPTAVEGSPRPVKQKAPNGGNVLQWIQVGTCFYK